MLNLLGKQNKKEEFEELLLSCMNSMYSMALRLSRNKETAEDLVQDTSIRAFRFYHKYEQNTNFKAWILTILRNLFINSYRKKSKEPYKINYNEFESIIGAPDMTGVAEEVFGESLQKSMDKLPEDLRTVVNLFYVEGLSYKEISGVMECPIGTVMSRLHMARKMLKKKLMQLMAIEGMDDELPRN